MSGIGVAWQLPDGSCQHISAQNTYVLLWVPPEADTEVKIQVLAARAGSTGRK